MHCSSGWSSVREIATERIADDEGEWLHHSPTCLPEPCAATPTRVTRPPKMSIEGG